MITAANTERKIVILHTDIALTDNAGAVWFSAYAADIAFSYCPKNSFFEPRVEEIRYHDRHGGTVILTENKADYTQNLCFILLAGGIEHSFWFKNQAWNLICNNAGRSGRTAAPAAEKPRKTGLPLVLLRGRRLSGGECV